MSAPDEVLVSDEIDAPAAAVWSIMGDFGGVASWSKGIESCEVEGDGVGAVRTLTMPGGVQIRERLESHDDSTHTFQYSIVEPSPLPATGYLATVAITAIDEQRARIDWSSTFEPSADAEQVRGLIQGIYTGGIAALKQKLAS